jgi:hypothetical protein
MKSEETTATPDWLGVFESVLNATRATFVEGKNSVWDYANPEHFSSLWKSLEDESVKTANRVLILWSQTPPDESVFPVSTVEHVSPLHWAACAARKYPQIQVCVLDLNPTAHRSHYLYEHYLSCEKRRLPWIRVVQAAHFFGSESINGEFQPDAPPVGIGVLECRLFPQTERKRGLVLAGHFVDRIRNELTSPQNAENRHAISNIIGPMVLRSGRTLPGETSGVAFIKNGTKSTFPPVVRGTVSHRCALNSILRVAGLMCAQVSEDTDGARTPDDSTGWLALDDVCEQVGLNPAELRITLVDDQWSQGWLDWIKGGLGTTPVELQVSPDPFFLLRLLRAAGSESRQFSLSLDVLQNQTKSPKQDILLLDLRLFTGNSTAEREFLIALDAMLNSLSTSGKAGVDRLDLEVVRRRLEALGGSGIELSSAEHARYVTMLPRLIARLDFSLPIIIFSSTGQRDVAKQFENAPSIITDFSKPRHFQGADEEVVTRAEQALIKSVENAIRWLRGRKLVQQIQARPLDQLQKARERCSGYTHFELYFDESGIPFSPRFRCAALLIGYTGGDKQTYTNDAVLVHQQMRDERLIWYPPFSEAVADSDYLDKNQKNEPKENRWLADTQWLEKVAEPLSRIFGDRPVIPFAVSRTPVSSETPDELDLAHPDALDNAFCDLLQLLLEITLVEVLPVIASDLADLSLHVYGATRQKTVLLKSRTQARATEEGMQLWQRFQDKYGFDSKDIVTYAKEQDWPRGSFSLQYRSLRGNAMLPMLARTLAARSSSRHAKFIQEAAKRAVAVVLTDVREPAPIVRHQHYICDRLAHICDVPEKSPDAIDLRVLNSWTPFVESGVGFLGRRNQAFLNLLDCGRFLDAKNLPSSFALGGAVLAIDGLLAEAIASRLQAEISNLSPDLFSQLCDLMADRSVLEARAVVPADRFGHSQNQPPAARKPSPPIARVSKPAFRSYVDAHISADLEACLDTKDATTSHTDSPTKINTAGPATREQFARIAKCWKIRRFKNQNEYMTANIPWHTMSGFHVRKGNSKTITVFAQLEKLTHADLSGFIEPDSPTLFTAKEELFGRVFSPIG